MLVGETGSGKSTLVDGMVNYVMGVNFDDPFRFTIVQLEERESKIGAEVLMLTSTNKNSDVFFEIHLSIASNQIRSNLSCQTFCLHKIKFY